MKTLLESQKKFLDAITLGVSLVDAQQPDYPIVYVNRTFEKLTGYSEAEVLGRNSQFLQTPFPHQTGLHKLEKAMANGQECQVILRTARKDGTAFWNGIQLSPIYDDDHTLTYLLMIQSDVSRYFKGHLQFDEEFYRLLIRNMPNTSLLIFDRDLRFIIAEGLLLEAAGFPIEDIEGRTLWEVLPAASAQRLEPMYRQALQGQNFSFETDAEGKVYHVNVVPITLGESNIIAGLFIIYDVTESRQIEHAVQDLNSELAIYARQLEAVNQELEAFTYSVSHDLRAPLRAMDGFSQALLENFGEALPERAKHYLQRIRYNATQMGELINSLLALSRLGRQPLRKQPFSVQKLVQEILDSFAENLKDYHITLDPLPDAFGDPALIKQVFANLIENAIKYSQKQENPQIYVGTTNPHTYFVKDNGIGFDMEYYHKLFNVFQRLHNSAEYPGQGVGLATVQRIIHRHGGRVWAESEVDKGATFYIDIG